MLIEDPGMYIIVYIYIFVDTHLLVLDDFSDSFRALDTFPADFSVPRPGSPDAVATPLGAWRVAVVWSGEVVDM